MATAQDVPAQSGPPVHEYSAECDFRIGAAAVGDLVNRRSLPLDSGHTSGRKCYAECPTRLKSAAPAVLSLPRSE